ncbi:hypothetical protein DXC11_03230 [Firmicutes bacterium OM08-11AC]|jgi:hypothetical protein|uniref:Gp28/Gp37-like domain-containing protein n=2 Tax=unclassified Caudoviricetes TaxID=2788787 RepID=A0A8S5Q0R1_9CAUD|nr:hypothetical protein DXC11_03230 [Firmicutes bacterium OM08-11AC]DAD82023.1 MAG TPA: hypothetical protein [Siphoviridae sp. ctkL634]DAE12331.1 MAG TPA: hypothetical protein [Siphoviridae sp. ctG0D7]
MEIYILDRNLNIVGVISTYDSILWTEKVHEPGNIKAVFVFTEKMNRILQRGYLLYKTDELQPAVITRKTLKLNKYGQQTITIQGYMVTRYFRQRIIWKKMIMKGTPEQLMRQMVQEQIIAPEDDTRKIPLIELGDLQNFDMDEVEKQITYDNLQEALTDMSKTTELGYRLRLDYARKKLVFEVYRGTNRTQGTEHPCIFTRKFKNVFTQEYNEDEGNYKNVCLVGGPGEDTDRVLVTVGSGAGLDRYEMFYNASGYSEDGITAAVLQDQLRQKGLEKMSAYYIAKAFEVKINKEKAMKFDLGDYVTCKDTQWGITVDTQVKVIQKGYSKTEASYVITLGDDVPTLINLIKAKE